MGVMLYEKLNEERFFLLPSVSKKSNMKKVCYPRWDAEAVVCSVCL